MGVQKRKHIYQEKSKLSKNTDLITKCNHKNIKIENLWKPKWGKTSKKSHISIKIKTFFNTTIQKQKLYKKKKLKFKKTQMR